MTTTETRLLTAEDLLQLYGRGERGELIRGVLCETMSTGIEHGRVVMNLGAEIRSYAKHRRLGTLFGSDAGVWLERDPDTVREPDIAFILADRLSLDTRTTGYSEVVPDLVVEVRSPSDTHREVNDKARMWVSYGVRLVWVVHPDTRTVDIHRPGEAVATLGEDDALDGLDALPGFTCPVTEVFAE